VFGAGERTLVLLGDSHAAHWTPALREIGRSHGMRLTTLTRSSCPWVGVVPFNLVLRREFKECAASRDSALARIAALKPSAVVLSNSYAYLPESGRLAGRRFAPAEWEAGARRTLLRLDSLGIQVFVLLDTPSLLQPAPLCLSRAALRGSRDECGTARTAALDAPFMRAERRAAAGLRHVTVLDLSDLFCGPVDCGPVGDGIIIYHDHDHLTATFSSHLAPVLEERMGM
jgi:hypothetical protein